MKKGYPSWGDLVVCRVTRINPNSAFVKLLEYDKNGMVHVSEIASRWVRNIREFVKENELVVCKVGRVDDQGHISLSIKRVNRSQGDRKLQEYKKEGRAEKLLQQASGKEVEQIYDEIGHQLIEEFGSLYKVFEIAMKNPELITKKGIPKQWADIIIDTAKKSFVEKTYAVKANLKLICHSPEGLELIKKSLGKIKRAGFDVRYVSAPDYLVTGGGKNVKELITKLEAACSEALADIEKAGGEGELRIDSK